jgi:hypothetical protein
VRNHLLPSTRFARAAIVVVSLVLLAACGGGGSGLSNPGSTALCDQNAGAISVARPTPGYPQNGNQIEIVSSTNTDQLNGNPGQFDLNLVDNFGNEIDTGFLTPVPDTGGPHPYTNDFFYAGTLPGGGLFSNRTYTVYLNAPNTNCTRGFIGQIFT